MAYALVGSRLAHYEVLAPLGAGAMSEVYRCRDTRLDREVAVKVIHEAVAERANVVERFEREARTAARVEHPHVARVHYSGSHEGMPFYAMELVEGWSVSELLDNRVPFTWEHLLALFAQVASGLQAAIDLGVVHGDVKPANVIVGKGGTAKIVDFGLARFTSEPTRTGRMLGTPYYMAPEVICGEPGDHRSDLYSLGATLFHVLSGRPPFDGETPSALVEKHVVEPAPYLKDLNPDYPQRLSSLVGQLMAKDPQDRPPSYREFMLRIQRTREEMPPETLAAVLSWCSNCELNTEGRENACARCGQTYGARERPEWFHVDLVGWLRNNAEDEVAAYVSGALGVSVDQIHDLLQPLPYRAAFRLGRERARRMQRRFFDLGADVSLVPVEAGTGGPAREQLRALPFKPVWPPAPAVPSSKLGGRSAVGGGVWTEPSREGDVRPALVLGAVALALSAVLLVEHQALQDERAHVASLEAQLRASASKTAASSLKGVPTPSHVKTRHEDPNAVDFAQAEDGSGDLIGRTWTVAPDDEGVAVAGRAQDDEAPPPEVVISQASQEAARPLRSTWFTVRDEADLGPDRTRALAALLDREARVIDRQVGLPSSLSLPVRLMRRQDGAGRQPIGRGSLGYSPAIEITIEPAAPEEVLVSLVQYQLTRAAVQQAGGPGTPYFLREGLALYLELGAPTSAEVTALVAKAPRPIGATGGVGEGDEVLEQSLRAFASYLVQTRGMEAVRETLASLKRGIRVDEAFDGVLGGAPSELQAEWLLAHGFE